MLYGPNKHGRYCDDRYRFTATSRECGVCGSARVESRGDGHPLNRCADCDAVEVTRHETGDSWWVTRKRNEKMDAAARRRLAAMLEDAEWNSDPLRGEW